MTASVEPGEIARVSVAPPGRVPWGRLLAVLVASRLVVLAAALVAESGALIARNPLLTSGDGGPVLRSLTTWDGWWYLSIVRDGYHAQALEGAYHDYAFLPLYPMLVRALAIPFPGWEGLVAVVLSNALFVLGLVLLVRLTAPRFGVAMAVRSAGLLAFFPFAAVFSMAYAESLFLVLMLAAFLCAERGRAAWAGVFLALATLTRLQGAALIVPLAWVLWDNAGRPRPVRTAIRPAWLALLLGPAAAVGAYLWVIWLTGDAASYAAAQGAWGRSGLGGDATGTLGDALTNTAAIAVLFTQAVNFVVLVWAMAVYLLFRRRDHIPGSYQSVPVLFFVMVFVSGSIQSIGRLLMPAFPLHWMLAKRGGVGGRIVWPAFSVLALFGLSVAMFAGWFVP